MDKPSLGGALQALIDEQPGLLARVIKGPKNRRLFQPLQRFFGLANTNGASAPSSSAPPSASSSPIPTYAPPHYMPPHAAMGMGGSTMGLPGPFGSGSAPSSRSSSPSRAAASLLHGGVAGSGGEPVWADALKSAYKRWLELDRGFGAATVQVRLSLWVSGYACVWLIIRSMHGRPGTRISPHLPTPHTTTRYQTQQ